ncbi:Uncharacterised protein [Acinetobacter baumannii]|nr:Uncharacterised protein [Acinetobacter baumannii]
MLAGRLQADAVGGHVEAVAETYQQVLRGWRVEARRQLAQ